MIAYKKTNGIAHDIRFVPDDYAPQEGEFTAQGDVLDRDALSDRGAVERASQANDARLKLQAIDRGSIRAMREWVSKQADAPQVLKDREAEAIVERAKLR